MSRDSDMRLQGVIFDWAGTLVDHGSRAPVATMQRVFAKAGVPVTAEEVRLSMGIAKLDHIRSILQVPRVAAAFEKEWGAALDARGTDGHAPALYREFVPMQLECLGEYSDLIAGVAETAEGLRSRGIAIGSTTGYTREMLDFLVERARAQGFAPDCSVSPEDVPGGGRPAPWMCYLNAIRLKMTPFRSMVKIGDTPSDIEEGLNAGMWTVGVTRTGNEAGLSKAEWEAASADARAVVIDVARTRLIAAGAHYLVESAGECLSVIDEISDRVAAGERPDFH